MKSAIILILSLLFINKTNAQIFAVDTLPKPKKDPSKSILFDANLSEAIKNFQPKIIKASPEVAAFQSLGHVAVGHYTGKPNINIDLFSLEGKAISTALSLNYDASGIKVEQEASQVGLGWSLAAGGMISRNIKGRDDFDGILRLSNSDQANLNTIRSMNYVISKAAGNVEWQFDNYSDDLQDIDVQLQLFCQNTPPNPLVKTTAQLMLPISSAVEAGKPRLDGESDIFSFQAGGYSGKFLITTDDYPYKIYTIGQEPIKIEILPSIAGGSADLSGQSGFKITTPDGVQYFYEQTEKVISRGGESFSGRLVYPDNSIFNDPVYAAADPNWDLANMTASIPSISGWFLTKIVAASNQNDIITFNYTADTDYSAIALPSRIQNLTVGTSKWRLTDNRQKNALLTSIQSSKGSIEFTRSPRTDIRGTLALKLDKITLKDKFAVQVMAYQFDYGYFDSGTGQPDIVSKRLKLNSLTELGNDNATKPAHLFTYFDKVSIFGTQTIMPLPDKNSYAQDFWGNYNGETFNNTKSNTAVPTTNYTNGGTMIPANIPAVATTWGFTNPAIREANEDYCKLGTLKNILYPTKGLIEFDMEMNQFGNYTIGAVPNSIVVNNSSNATPKNGGGLRVKATKLFPNPANISDFIYRKYDYSYSGGAFTKGKLMFDMSFSTLINNGSGSPYQLFSSSTKYPISYSANGSPIGYSSVREIDVNPVDNTTNGYIDHEFENEVERRHDSFCFVANVSVPTCNSSLSYFGSSCAPYTPVNGGIGIYWDKLILENTTIPNDLNNRSGLIKNKIYYDRLDQKVKKETYSYVQSNGTERPRIKNLLVNGRQVSDPYPALFTYYVDIDWVKLDKLITIDYLTTDPENTIIEETYAYNQLNKQVKEIIRTNAQNEVFKTEMTYPVDYFAPVIYEAMTNKNMILPVVEQKVTNLTETTEVAKINYTYKDFTSNSNSMILLENAKHEIAGINDDVFEVTNNYDEDANIIASNSRQNVPISYLWAYSGDYPVAEIKGATELEVNTALSSVGISRATLRTQNDESVLNYYLNLLRNYWINTDVVVSQTTMKQLVGNTTMTSTNQLKSSFDYDNFSRLFLTKDINENLIKKVNYTFATTSSSSCTTPAAPSISVSSSTLCNVSLSATGCSGIINWSNGQSGTSISVTTSNSANISATCSVGACTSLASNILSIPVLPIGWQSIDIGSSTVNGCTQYSSGVLTLQSDGPNNSIAGNYGADPDKFHFVYKTFTGDVTVITKLTGMTAGDGNRSGIMIRNSLDPKAVMFSIIQDNNNAVGKLLRNSENGDSHLWQFNGANLNNTWTRLDKVGNTVTARFSTLPNPNPAIATDWQEMLGNTGNPAPSMTWNGSFYLGFVSMAYPSGSAQTVFSNLSVNGSGL